jgi:DNA-binding MarR family transcriptional regulator
LHGTQSLEDIHLLPAHLIRRCHQIAAALFHEECPGNLTPVQYAALSVISRHEAIDQITLAGLTALNRSTAGDVIDRLEAAGLVLRGSKAGDRRINLVSLTPAGRERLRELEAPVKAVQRRLLAPLDDEEQEIFIRLLAKVANENNEMSRAPLRRAPLRLQRA